MKTPSPLQKHQGPQTLVPNVALNHPDPGSATESLRAGKRPLIAVSLHFLICKMDQDLRVTEGTPGTFRGSFHSSSLSLKRQRWIQRPSHGRLPIYSHTHSANAGHSCSALGSVLRDLG